MTFDFFQDYIDHGGTRYYALRIPYNVIAELHRREFKAVLQARSPQDVNDIQEAYGFSFMVAPEVAWSAKLEKGGEYLSLRTTRFVSRATGRANEHKGGLETLAMLMVDPDYDGRVFALGSVSYGAELQEAEGTIRIPVKRIGDRVMAVWVDHHGNELRIVISRDQCGLPAARQKALSAKASPEKAKKSVARARGAKA
jgi:hypothetical protein